jgi:hypothetical protein
MWREVTRKVWETADDTDITDFLTVVRRGGRPTTGCPIGRPGSGNRQTPYPFVSALSVQSVVNFILAQSSRLLFLAEFLECGIGAQRVPHWIKRKKGGRHGYSIVKPALIWRF